MRLSDPLMARLRDLPLAAKLNRAAVLVIGTIGLLAMALMVVWDAYEMRSREESNLRMLAQVIARQEAAPLMFGYAAAAEEDLTALREIPDIVDAVILKPDGAVFARYVRPETGAGDLHSGILEIKLTAPILMHGKRLGAVRIHARLTGLLVHLAARTGITMLALGVAMVAGLLLFNRLAAFIGAPLARVSEAAARLGAGDMSQRVEIASKDEVGLMAAAFNRMAADLQETTVSLDYVENILNSMMNALVVVSPDATIRQANQAALSMLGYAKQELIGLPIGAVIERKEETILRGPGFIAGMETTWRARDGRRIPVLFSGSVMRSVGGKIQGIVCAATDIRGRKQAEEEMKRVNRELMLAQDAGINIMEDLVRRKDELDASLKEKDVLLREIHHRVKNNMQVISSLLGLEARAAVSEDVVRIMHKSQRRVRAMGLVHERLYRSPDLSRVDFRDYIQAVLRELQVATGTDSRKVRVVLDLKKVTLGVDQAVPGGLLIHELITNALKHAFPEGRPGTLMISLREPEENRIELTVADDGVGMAEDFDWRHTDSLGLRLVLSLTGQLHGRITLERERGVRVRVRFKKRA